MKEWKEGDPKPNATAGESQKAKHGAGMSGPQTSIGETDWQVAKGGTLAKMQTNNQTVAITNVFNPLMVDTNKGTTPILILPRSNLFVCFATKNSKGFFLIEYLR
ncbi:hypothetical protein K7X08_022884 [Anisodus acutangulus]|uniref:Uncharacterized protein n=1 Tax=Anisodus acutangulus TaxID=402998 RepID=A0A9Q1MC30_9SOLA|nr:hypothetical protein K7X08_022884 [Anisodus acutangulus]